jgi:hypothetical protein
MMMNGWLEIEYCNDETGDLVETAIITNTYVSPIMLGKFGFADESYFKKGAKVWFITGKDINISESHGFLKEKDVIKLEVEQDEEEEK